MTAVFENMDSRDHEEIVFCRDKDTGLKAIIAVHNTTIGPALGGLIGDAVGWRSNFWLYTGAGLGLWVLVWAQLPETAELGKRTLTDFAKTYLELLQSRYFWSYTIIMALAIGAFLSL